MTPGNLLSRTKHWIRKSGIKVSKQLGQHFLIDERVLKQIINYAKLSEEEKILEIGAGMGTLTEALVQHVQHVYAIEKDLNLYNALMQAFGSNERITLIHGDAVKLNWPTTDRLVANLPYNISSPIIFKFLDSKMPVAVLMLQQEFAERLTAHPGTKDYGRLTIMVAYVAEVELLERIDPDKFYPSPAVSSAIVRITRYPEPAFPVADYPLFADLVKAVFNQRRKKLRNPLKTFLTQRQLSSKSISAILSQIPFLDYRAEEVPPADFAKMSNKIYEEIT